MPATRRDFLKSTAAAAFAIALSKASAKSKADPTEPGGSIRSFVTGPSGQRFSHGTSYTWNSQTQGPAIVVDPSKTAQTISGFGSALTEASCYVLDQMPEPAKSSLLAEFFSPDQMGLTVCRLCIGSSDYATTMYSYDDHGPDPNLTAFSIDHDRAHVIPILRRAASLNPNLFLFGSPWSPPGWMKYGGSMLGGSIKPKYLEAYSHYILKYLQAYQAAGVHVSAVTMQNELDADQGARMPACTWPQETEALYIQKYLGPLLRKESPKTKIWILDHNYNLIGRVLDVLAMPEVKPFVDAVAWHGYAGEPEQMKRVWDAYPGFEMHWTEGGDDFVSRDYLTDWSTWSAAYARILRNGPSSITTWNIALDENGRPDIGPFSCGGVVTVHSQTNQVIRGGLYWTLAHYSRAFRPGSKIIESHGHIDGISHIAAKRPDGSIAVILTNTGKAQTVYLSNGDRGTNVTLPADTIITLEWNA
jgi:glucosylceramidase